MSEFVKKSDIVRSAVSCKDWKKALRIAKDFRIGITPDQRDLMTRAYECMVRPDFYRMIGKDPESEIKKGVEVVSQIYGR